MICKICKRAFVIKRDIVDLFLKQRYFICDECYIKNPVDIKLSKMPLDDNYTLTVISILDEEKNIFFDAYLNEYSYLVEKYIHKTILLYDVFKLNKTLLDNLSVIAKLERTNICVLCFKFIIN